MTTRDEVLRVGEEMDLTRLSLKAAAQNLLRLSTTLTGEGVIGHVAPLRAAHGSILDALRSLEFGVEKAGIELAKKLEAELASHPPAEKEAIR